MQVSKNGKNQLRNVTCIPEEFVYGWIFSLRSDSKELIEYKKVCYQLLYNHFHGIITKRKDILIQKFEIEKEISQTRIELMENEQYNKLQDLNTKLKSVKNKLNKSDKLMIEQSEFNFEQID